MTAARPRPCAYSAIFERTKYEQTRLVLAIFERQARDRRNVRAAARSDDQLVIGFDCSIASQNALRFSKNRIGLHADVQRDAIVAIPIQRIQINFAFALASVQHVREQNAVVVAVRLIAEHSDLELPGAIARQDLLDSASAGHAIADYHKVLLLHKFKTPFRCARRTP
jgi:hypothetical protein